MHEELAGFVFEAAVVLAVPGLANVVIVLADVVVLAVVGLAVPGFAVAGFLAMVAVPFTGFTLAVGITFALFPLTSHTF